MKQMFAIICLMLTTLTADAAKRTDSQIYQDTKTRVISIIAEQIGLPVNEVTENKSFQKDLKMSPKEIESVRDALSQEIGQEISDESAAKITTVQRAINFVFIRLQ